MTEVKSLKAEDLSSNMTCDQVHLADFDMAISSPLDFHRAAGYSILYDNTAYNGEQHADL